MNFKICLFVFVLGFIFYTTSEREKRTLLSLLSRTYRCRSRSCPHWKCQDDSAVIHGYCCHCPGWEYDNVPVPCSPDLICPPPEPLCSDYNFMMDCCCTGP